MIMGIPKATPTSMRMAASTGTGTTTGMSIGRVGFGGGCGMW